MEDINKTDITNQVQPETQPVETPTPPKQNNNIFKLLFFVSIFILIAVIVVGFLIIKKSNKETVNNNSSIKTIEETGSMAVEEIFVYEAKFIEDDKNQISKLVLIDKDKKEIVISETKYFDIDIKMLKPKYKFTFSSDNNYLYYTVSFYEGGASGIYDIQNKVKVDIPFLGSSGDFDKLNNYFYSCDEGGIGGGGAVIYKIPGLLPVYNKGGSFHCEYNKVTDSLSITEYSTFGEHSQKTESFSFISGTLLK